MLTDQELVDLYKNSSASINKGHLAALRRVEQRVAAEVIGLFGARAFDDLSIVELCHHARSEYGLLGEDEEPFDFKQAIREQINFGDEAVR